MKKCLVIGCRHNTVEFIHGMLHDGLPVDAVLTIDRAVSEKVDVSGYVDIKAHVPGEIPVFKAKSYGLNHQDDASLLKDLKFKVGFCIGWQRLIPGWFLEQSETGVFGMHASNHYLPGGRGRSPINWSIINSASVIHANVFRYGAEADEGDILDIADIDISPHDNILSVQKKCRIAFNRIVRKHWDDLDGGNPVFGDFPEDPPSWFDKRTPEDGRIRWDAPAEEIYNFIRAQTRPYPGAFTLAGDGAQRYHIWAAYPFSSLLTYNDTPGTVLEVFLDNMLLVQTRDYALYVVDHEIPAGIKKGDILK